MMRRLLMSLLLAASVASSAQAGESKVGTSGAQFLKIGAGARPTAMGEAFTAIADDANATYFNPAGLAQLERAQLTAMHTQWFQGLDYAFGAYAMPTSVGTFGLSASTLRTDPLERRAADESVQGTFDSADAAYGLSYANDLTETVALGVTARLVRLELAGESASAWGGDLGVLKRFGKSGYSVGLAARHLGQEVKFDEEGDPLPFVVDLGGAGRFLDGRLLVGVNLLSPRDNDLQYGAGLEFAERNADRFRYAGRLGYRSAATDADGATGISVGAGLGYRRVDFDFAWVPFGDLGNTFRYALTFNF